MENKFTAYIALLRCDGTEPDKASGYERACIGEVDMIDVPTLLQERQILFPDVMAPGYGEIAAVAVSDRKTAGTALWVWPLPETVNVHENVVPVIFKGKLLRGVETQARVKLKFVNCCELLRM